jgi:hypothetical protein
MLDNIGKLMGETLGNTKKTIRQYQKDIKQLLENFRRLQEKVSSNQIVIF